VIGGTSAVAPLWAGLIARINELRAKQSLPAVGFLNPILYANEGALNDIEKGNNNGFSAAAGWDACTGLGSPDGQVLASVLVKDGADPKGAGNAEAGMDKAFIAKGNAFMAKGNAFMAKGNAFIAKGNAFMAKGNAAKAEGGNEVPRSAQHQKKRTAKVF
jgi:hypothetical protein